jgi:hypothetical protein
MTVLENAYIEGDQQEDSLPLPPVEEDEVLSTSTKKEDIIGSLKKYKNKQKVYWLKCD